MTMTQAEMQDRVIAKASEDEEFRARLLADPRAAIEELTGEVIPDAVSVQVHQESATSFHLVLPAEGQLSEAELGVMVGGDEPSSGTGSSVPDIGAGDVGRL